MEYHYLAIDVSKDKLDVLFQGKFLQIVNNKKSITSYCKNIENLNRQNKSQVCVVCEPTGGYETMLIRCLQEYGIAYHIAHANHIRAFAKAKGCLAKTDKIDCRLIYDYAVTMISSPDRFMKSKNAEEIAALVKRRDQLVAEKLRETNRLDKPLLKSILSSHKKHIKWLEKEIKALEAEIESYKEKTDISESYDLLTSVPSVGALTAFSLIGLLPELGTLTHKEVSALVGVAPFNRDSGRTTGRRYVQGGRGHVRRKLYLCAVVAVRCNPDMKSFYQRLKVAGKPTKVALTAVMRKLIIMLNSIMKRRTPWVPSLS